VIETPAVVLDLDRLERNLARWQAECDRVGMRNRPHVKTHKCVEIAKRQVELGAIGVTCQTLFEAETMVGAGIDDVLVPVNIVGASKLARLARLHERATLTVSVDDARLLPGLAEAAGTARPLRVLVDCDTGLGRTGVATPAAAAELATAVARTGGLRFEGFITYPSPPGAATFLEEAIALAAAAGHETTVVSAGGTPGMWQCGELAPPLTEYRVGTYAFHDRTTVAAGSATFDDVAMTVLSTVISRPAPGRAVLDAGSKALTSDPGPDAGFGSIVEAPGATVMRLNEEHGYVALDGDDNGALALGERVHVVPNHACVVSNLFERFVVVSGGHAVDEWPIARGR
jgi:D-serine deaminase-like pyridoxal phosphate-dependent protein